jgi:DNA-binding CsgD family transcriptional regulator
LAAERDGRLDEAVATLRVVLEPPWDVEMAERWQLLAALVRAALAAGDPALVEAAARASAAEAEQGGTASRLVAADHARGLVAADPDLLLDVAERYQALLRPLEAAQAAEDAGAAYAQRGGTDSARAALTRALDGYAALGAEWDIGRVRARFRGYGIRRSMSGARPRETSGWGSLSPTEAKVAGMIAEGMSNRQIADRMFLSKRTVETHISHIFGKLGLRSRVEIAREASRHAGAEP